LARNDELFFIGPPPICGPGVDSGATAARKIPMEAYRYDNLLKDDDVPAEMRAFPMVVLVH
jgi:hypothetical protein